MLGLMACIIPKERVSTEGTFSFSLIFHFLTSRFFASYTLTFLWRREPLCGTFLYSIWCFAFGTLA